MLYANAATRRTPRDGYHIAPFVAVSSTPMGVMFSCALLDPPVIAARRLAPLETKTKKKKKMCDEPPARTFELSYGGRSESCLDPIGAQGNYERRGGTPRFPSS
ncbi:hypothetical protein BSKO_14162 [Bryopsis sp. KO-2023]|nr:hypothetical protein BSKO_14162 [Bryopsis sp. KO-2023]